MGTPDIAATCLKKILTDGFDVVGVYTQPDRPKGRGMKMVFSPVKEVALRHDLPVFQPENFKDEAAVQQLSAIRDSLVFSSPALFLLGGFERILAMTAHLGMSLVVAWGVYEGKHLGGCLISLCIHTLIDLSAGLTLLIGNGLSQSAAYLIIYSLLTAAAIASTFMILKIRKQWLEKEEP